jgi:phenylalanyl-tRNA synthetase beta chain
MKFTLSWLRDHLETDAPLARITDTLSAIGLEVESVADPAAKLAPFVTARVIEATQHPNANRLRVCRVDVGTGEEIQVVCGAPNARTGMAAVFAPPGAVIPGTGITLKVGEIRGTTSAGMLVSARELALGEDHDGIIELPEGTPAGQAYARFAGLDDPIIEIGVTPNRGDALAVRGIARDLAAAGLGVLKPRDEPPAFRGFASIAWKNEYPAACPWIMGRLISKVSNGASPEWLRRRLVAVGLRPINALVDVTNFFALDLGRPLHVFDANLISGGTLTVRKGRHDEPFIGLDGHRYDIDDGDIVIADASGVISLGGIMGGKSTGVTEKTTNVFVECALFDPVRIALTGRRQQLHTDARARFERGVDQSLLPHALDAATAMILKLCGGEASEPVSAGGEPAWRRTATMRFRRIREFGGADVSADVAVDILGKLGFSVASRSEDEVTVQVPPWRNDVAGNTLLDTGGQVEEPDALKAAEGAGVIEPECELIEEVLRIYGIDRIAPMTLPPPTPVPAPAVSGKQARLPVVRRLLAARGLAECVTFSFMRGADAAEFGGAPENLRLLNPIAADLDQMRPTPLATLVPAVIRNAARGWPDLALFEIGPAYRETGEMILACGLRAGSTPRDWQNVARNFAWLDVKADVWAVLRALSVPLEALSITADAPGWYHPGRSGVVRQGPRQILAQFGDLHPALLMRFGLAGPVCGFEIFLDDIAEPKRRRRQPPDMSPLQPVRRDFALVMDTRIAADSVLRAARNADKALIVRVTLFDVYEGSNLPEGQKSLGLEVTLQPKERTLTDQEIEAVSTKVLEAVGKVGARLRQ